MNKFLKNTLIIDGSYMIHRSLKSPELWKMCTSNGTRTGGVYGFIRSLFYCIKKYIDYYPIICWDKGLSKRRLDIYPNYKGREDKDHRRKLDNLALNILTGTDNVDISNLSNSDLAILKESVNNYKEIFSKHHTYKDPDDYVTQYVNQRDMIISLCKCLKIPSIIISGQEGDDLMTILSRASTKSVIVTDDKDLIQLASPEVKIYRVMNDQLIDYYEYLNDNDMKSIRESVIIKAICGDASDNIPSVTSMESEKKYRVGLSTAKRLARVIIDNEEDSSRYISFMRTIYKDKNKIEGFIRNHDYYERNLKLVDLSLVEEDIDIVNNIVSEINTSLIGRVDFFNILSKFKDLEITSIDVNYLVSIVSKLSNPIISEV